MTQWKSTLDPVGCCNFGWKFYKAKNAHIHYTYSYIHTHIYICLFFYISVIGISIAHGVAIGQRSSSFPSASRTALGKSGPGRFCHAARFSCEKTPCIRTVMSCLECNNMQCNATQYNAMQSNAMQCSVCIACMHGCMSMYVYVCLCMSMYVWVDGCMHS